MPSRPSRTTTFFPTSVTTTLPPGSTATPLGMHRSCDQLCVSRTQGASAGPNGLDASPVEASRRTSEYPQQAVPDNPCEYQRVAANSDPSVSRLIPAQVARFRPTQPFRVHATTLEGSSIRAAQVGSDPYSAVATKDRSPTGSTPSGQNCRSYVATGVPSAESTWTRWLFVSAT